MAPRLEGSVHQKEEAETQKMVVFCITCKGRVQHIKETLPKNLADNPTAKFILVSYGDTTGLDNYIWEDHQEAMASGQLCYYRFPAATTFKMAHAKNMAHRLGVLEGGTILVNLDADNYAGQFTDYVIEQFQTPKVFLAAKMLKGVLPKGISGRIVVSKPAFLNAGGYDEKYETYSPDDKDFNARLRRLGYSRVDIDNKYLNAIRHNDKMRFKEYPHATTSELEEEFVINQTNTLVNYGNIGCGVVYKNFSTVPIELKPLPTKIFGIGMHKTATTSLHKALQTLDYESGHWKSAHWAKKLYNEAMWGPSFIVETHNALCDLPIPLLYQQLDKTYPNSKFILTLREEQDWLRSVEKHWSPLNPFRHQWDEDPFTHRVHKLLYGQTEFNAELFLQRYKQHTQEVLNYFKDRPQDLLIMDMSKGAGWKELCGFLAIPIPPTPYPTEFISKHG